MKFSLKLIALVPLVGAMASCSANSSDTFMVSWTVDYGYRLNPPGDLDKIIDPEFETKTALQNFDAFFSNENLARNVGRRIYCECVGERYERDGVAFYKVREARIFAK